MPAKLPRLHLYNNAIRARFKNRSIDLVKGADGDGCVLNIVNANAPNISECVTVIEGVRGNAGSISIRLSDEALDALTQALLLRAQEWKKP